MVRVSVPCEYGARVLAIAEEFYDGEGQIRAAARGSLRLDEARKRMRYHQLHTHEADMSNGASACEGSFAAAWHGDSSNGPCR